MITVTFKYDIKAKKWDPIVHGAFDEKEARQAFNAVVLTCQQLDVALLNLSKTQIIDNFNIRIIPAI